MRDTRSGNKKPCMKKTSSAVLGRTMNKKERTAGIFLDESHTWKARDRSCKSEATRKKASRFGADSVFTMVKDMTRKGRVSDNSRKPHLGKKAARGVFGFRRGVRAIEVGSAENESFQGRHTTAVF